MIFLFVNLHVHTEWSLLDGMCRIADLVPRVAELGQTAVGISDHGNMSGVIQFYKACKNYKVKDSEGNEVPHPIKPIIGLETYVVPDRVAHIRVKEEIEKNKQARKKMTDKQKKADDSLTSIKEAFVHLVENDESYFGNSVAVVNTDEKGEETLSYKFANSHLLLFAKTNEGYKNLINIATESQLTGFYSKPRIDLSYLREHGKGIIATSACRAGEIPRLILRGRLDLARKKIQEYCEIFDEFYLEIQPGVDPEQRIVNQTLIELSEEMGVPLVATTDAHYVRKEDAEAHDILLRIATDDQLSFDEKIYYIHSEEEMLAAGMPQVALDNSQKIADACNVDISFGKPLLPKVPIPEGYTSETYIRKLCQDSFFDYIREKKGIDVEQYTQRLNYELEVIVSKGLADYVLIVYDYVNWAKSHGVMVGPGRGSAAGSLVCFLLAVTTLDPIEHELMFERFLNPLRPSFPDVDMDFSEYITLDGEDFADYFKSGRQSVIEYVVSRYGEECICQIGTFGTMGTRSVLKDVGRALGIDHNEINEITKFVPSDSGKQWTLEECIYGNPEKDRLPVSQIVEYSRQQDKLFDMSIKLQGLPRHPSIHAAGVVISPVPIRDLIPLMRGGDGELVSQFEMGILEELGIIKFDFLGLRTLGSLQRTIELISKRHGRHIDPDEIDLNDPEAMKLIQSGQTDGVFQIESDGMKKMFRDMHKVNFEDIIAGLSLYRPGPLQFLPKYIACSNGYSKPEYLFPELEPILKSTFGILIYQEQLMDVARQVAGFDWLLVDKYRKAVGKKKEDLIKEMNEWLVYGHEDEEKDIHIPGLIKNGIDESKAIQLAHDIVAFGSYAFNRSHAASYAKLTAITAYLKAHYPVEYMTPLISSFIGKDAEKVVQYINEAKRMGARILPPDVNMSDFEFAIEGEPPYPSAIRYGLGAIKGLSKVAMVIADDRARNGRFESIDNFLVRFGKKEMNKKALDALVLSGALDSLAKELREKPLTVIDVVNGIPTPAVYGAESVLDESGEVDRLKLLELIYTLRDYGSIEGVIESYCDENHTVKIKKRYAKVSTIENHMMLLSIEHALLGMYITAHPLSGRAQPSEWQTFTHGMRFDVTCIIRNVRAITTRYGKPMAFLTIETLEGMKDAVIFTKEYESFSKKLEIGSILDVTMEAQLKDGSYCYIVKNIKLCKDKAS